MNFPTKISFNPNKANKNVVLFDAGLHTLGLRKSKDEKDNEFVTRFLIKFFEGRKDRDPDAKGFFICHQDGATHVSVGKIMSKEESARESESNLEEKIAICINNILERKDTYHY